MYAVNSMAYEGIFTRHVGAGHARDGLLQHRGHGPLLQILVSGLRPLPAAA
ncbi:hypothetical protein D3C81_1899860 [compost metagenome]